MIQKLAVIKRIWEILFEVEEFIEKIVKNQIFKEKCLCLFEIIVD